MTGYPCIPFMIDTPPVLSPGRGSKSCFVTSVSMTPRNRTEPGNKNRCLSNNKRQNPSACAAQGTSKTLYYLAFFVLFIHGSQTKRFKTANSPSLSAPFVVLMSGQNGELLRNLIYHKKLSHNLRHSRLAIKELFVSKAPDSFTDLPSSY